MSDRIFFLEASGGRVLSANADGSDLKTIIMEGRKIPDGVAVDVAGGKIHWTQKGGDNAGYGRIFRANVESPAGQSPGARTDIELLYDGLPEPIDLDINPLSRTLYWTDRGDPPRGNTVNRAPLDARVGERKAPEIVASHLMEGIGLALDPHGDRMFFTDLGGSVYRADLDGSNEQTILYAQGNLTGIAYAELPANNGRST